MWLRSNDDDDDSDNSLIDKESINQARIKKTNLKTSIMDVDGQEAAVDPSVYDTRAELSVLTETDAKDEMVANKARRDTEVFIGSIPLEAKESEVHAALRKCGAETGANGFELVTDRTSGKHRGYAFARYESAEAAMKAIECITASECEVKKQKIRASLKPCKYRVHVTGLKRDAKRMEVVEELRQFGAGLEFFELGRPRKGKEEEGHNSGSGFASYVNEACAERFMKNLKENKEIQLTIAKDPEVGLTASWAQAKEKPATNAIHCRNLNDANATEDALKESFVRFGTIQEVVVKTTREPKVGWVLFAKSEDAEKALAECDPIEGAPEGRKGGRFTSSVDGSDFEVTLARKMPRAGGGAGGDAKPKNANAGKGGPMRGGRDDWSKYRSGAGQYGGGIAPRSWSGGAARAPQNATPVILPGGQLAYAFQQGGPRRGGGGRGRRGGGDRHRPY